MDFKVLETIVDQFEDTAMHNRVSAVIVQSMKTQGAKISREYVELASRAHGVVATFDHGGAQVLIVENKVAYFVMLCHQWSADDMNGQDFTVTDVTRYDDIERAVKDYQQVIFYDNLETFIDNA